MTAIPAARLVLLATLGACLLVLGGLGIMLLARTERAQRLDGRLSAVVWPHRPAALGARRGGDLLATLRARAMPVLEVFGIRTDEAEMHRLPWGWALVAGLALARVVAGLMAAPLGEAALLLVPVIWVLLVRSFFQWCRTRHMALLYQQFPDALGMIVRSVRVGVTVAEALRTVAREAPFPTSIAFARLADRVSIGVALDEALRVMADRSGLPEYRFFATALSLQSQTGGALTETLENLADVIRRRVGLRKRAFALASEARTSALILTALPIVTGTALLIISPGYIAPLFYEPAGQKMLGAAVLSLSAGTLVMRAIISRSLS